MLWLLRYSSSTRRSEAEDEHGKSVKVEIASIKPVLQGFLDFFQISLAFSMFYIDVGRNQIELILKVKFELSVCTGLMLNDHSNPYILKVLPYFLIKPL